MFPQHFGDVDWGCFLDRAGLTVTAGHRLGGASVTVELPGRYLGHNPWLLATVLLERLRAMAAEQGLLRPRVMRARLVGGFAPAPMLSGGWYPVIAREGQRVTIAVDGAAYAVHDSFLELSDRERPNATRSFDPSHADATGFAELAPSVVCPAGHHIADVAPSMPTCRCGRCGREYEIET
jgi:hypothetical protein